MSRVPLDPYPHPQQIYYPPQPVGPPVNPIDQGGYGTYDRVARGWNGAPDMVYPPQPGPSRVDPYGAYAQPRASLQGRGQWSSVHPTATVARPDSRNAVKLEDLVSHERRPQTGRVVSGQAGMTSAPLGQPEKGTEGGQSGPSEFIKKLYRMLEDESATYGKGKPAGVKREPGAKRGSVGWGRGGTSFVVWDMNDFTTKVLPQTFRHSNFSSFVRQLNKYGFSKIKHVDEETGQIKDNVWEFQHPNFQAGGKADLDSIKRKAVVPKKGGNDDDEPSPRGLSTEDAVRMNEMESRIAGLEDQLAKALDEVRDARSREMGIMNVVRDVITHLASVEKETSGREDPTPRIMHLFQHFDQVASGSRPMTQPSLPQMQYTPARLKTMGGIASPHTDGSRESPSKGSTGSFGRAEKEVQPPTLYNGEPLEMTPIFGETSGWSDTLRRPSDLQEPAMVRFENVPDPLDTTPKETTTEMATVQQSPFGTLVIPKTEPADNIRLRRSTVIKPHWTQTPRILVVEDDVVYRQLSSKFLEKFGCITETVEDAQGAVEKMNAAKYDLVLMDIFFGPSMDGRKATSLIRQFDMYTPIISMTSNVQTQDVDSYLQSGMNDVLAKPFTKNGLFGILDKHLIHLKAIQLSAQVPRSLGVPPLSDQGVADAVATGAAQWGETSSVRNPLAAMGWSDETYQIVLQQYLATGSMPDANALNGSILATEGVDQMGIATDGVQMGIGTEGQMGIGTSVVLGDSSAGRKRSNEEDEWAGLIPNMMGGTIMLPSQMMPDGERGVKRVKK